MASTIPAARAAILAGLTALTATGQPLVGVRVVRSAEFEEQPGNEVLTVQGAEDIEREWHGMSHRLNESYTVPINVTVLRLGRDQAALETRFWAVITEIEKWVVSNAGQPLAGAVTIAHPDLDNEVYGVVGEDTLAAQTTVRVRCTAHHVALS